MNDAPATVDLQTLLQSMKKTAGLSPVKVTTKSWGTLYIRPPTVAEVDAQTEADKEETPGTKRQRFARAAARLICDANGRLLFDEKNPEHLALLDAQPWAELEAVLAKVDFAGGTPGK